LNVLGPYKLVNFQFYNREIFFESLVTSFIVL